MVLNKRRFLGRGAKMSSKDERIFREHAKTWNSELCDNLVSFLGTRRQTLN